MSDLEKACLPWAHDGTVPLLCLLPQPLCCVLPVAIEFFFSVKGTRKSRFFGLAFSFLEAFLIVAFFKKIRIGNTLKISSSTYLCWCLQQDFAASKDCRNAKHNLTLYFQNHFFYLQEVLLTGKLPGHSGVQYMGNFQC